MLKKKGAILIILLILVVGTNILVTAALTQANISPKQTDTIVLMRPEINYIDRLIRFGEYGGYITVNDTLSVYNNASHYLFGMYYYVPQNFSNYLRYISGISSNFKKLIIKEETVIENMTRYLVLFDRPLAPYKTYSFTITTAYIDIITVYNSTEGQTFNCTFFKFPLLDVTIENISITVQMPVTGQLLNYTSQFESTPSELSNETTQVAPFTFELFFVNYTFDADPAIEYSEIQKNYTVLTQVGYVQVMEKHVLRNIGFVDSFRAYSFLVPKDAYDIRIHDRFGNVTIKNVLDWGEYKRLAFVFTVEIKANHTYIYWVTYKLPVDDYQKEDSLELIFSIDSYSKITAIVRNLTINILLPIGSQIINVENHNFEINNYGDFTVITIKEYNVTEYNHIYIKVRYFPSFTGMLMRGFYYSVLIMVVIALYVVSRKSKRVRIITKAPVIEEKIIPVDLLKEFTQLYDEKMGYSLELEKMEEMRELGKIKKRDYELKKRKFNSELRRLEQELAPVAEKLKKVGERYLNAIRDLELLEEQRKSAIATMKFIKQRYRLRRISKNVFEKMMDEQMKKLRKATEEIDRIIFDLKALAAQ